jgi:hypothetical protein
MNFQRCFRALAPISAFGFVILAAQPAAAQSPATLNNQVGTLGSSSGSSSSSQCSGSSGSASIFVPGVGFVASSSSSSSSSGCYGQFQQDVLIGIVSNITLGVRDQLHRRLTTPMQPTAPLQFSGEASEFDGQNPFAAMAASDPFSALAYAKVYTKAPPPVAAPVWLYGANLVGSVDQSYTFGNRIDVGTVTGAFDVTKIGIFTATDALTFIGTGSGSWAHSFAGAFSQYDSSTPAASGTLSYLNGGFSADFTVLSSWTGYSAPLPLVAPTDNSVVSFIGNGQYRFDFAYGVFIEPTAGVTYTEVYTSGFGTKVADYTEVHGGARLGTEMRWMGYTIQPTLSGAVFQIDDYNLSTNPIAAAIIPASPNLGLGGRGSAKITVLWTPNFSSYLEGHTSGIAGTKTIPAIAALQTTGAQAGLRYSW